jgi:hypothetical protein
MQKCKGKYIRWSEDCVWHSIGDALAVVKVSPPDGGYIPADDVISGIVLNSIGRDIWDLCDGTRTFESIINQLLEEYKGDPEKIRGDIQKTVSQLKKESFVTYEDTSKTYDQIKIFLQKYVTWNNHVSWKETNGMITATNSNTDITIELKDEMGVFWKLCDGSKTINEVITCLEEDGTINEDMPPSGFILLLKKLLKLSMVSVIDDQGVM